MNAPKREYGFYLEDMKLSMERIEGYLENMTYLTFKENHLVIDAVIRNLEIIGEAAKTSLQNSNKLPLKSLGIKYMDFEIL